MENSTTKKVRVGIIGGAGYTGGEAIRLLIHHPHVNLQWVHSNSNGGNLLSDVHTDLLGDTQMQFASTPEWNNIDCVFLCVGHGDARKFLAANAIPSQVKVLDLSQDFRISPDTAISGREFVYGLPEMNFAEISSAQNIANPGCFATCLQLGLLPLAAAKAITDQVHISAITGSTGAGQSLSATSHFSWRANNLSVYKAFTHQHLREVRQMITNCQSNVQNVNFIPYRGDFTRGIIATTYTKFKGSVEEAYEIYDLYYRDSPFTHVSRKNISLKQVVNTNKCLVYLEKHDDNLVIISTIDNLLKGASGQAVQNMNIMFGLPQESGLQLKPAAF